MTHHSAHPLPALHGPRISVVVCNYNYAHYIAQAIESVLSQRYQAHELIVVDDGSTDDSISVIQRYAAHGVELIQQDNGGQVAAYNAGLPRCSGDVVLFLDADDALLPEALGAVAQAFEEGVVKVHYRLALMDPNGKLLDSVIPQDLASGDVARDFLRHGSAHPSAPASGNAYRRSVLTRIFPLPTDAQDRHGADFFCIYGSTLFGSVAACEQVLGLYRVHRSLKQTTGLSFGNVGSGLAQDQRLQARLQRFRQWISERTGGHIMAPSVLLDFSIEKSAFATAALTAPSRWEGTQRAARRLPQLLKALWLRRSVSVSKRLGLTLWAFFVLLAPRGPATTAARYVCDPGSRGSQRLTST
jgi:hypothetical protein